MSAENTDTTAQSHQQSAVQLNLVSLVLVTGLSGFCGGLAWAILTAILDMVGIIELVKFNSYVVNLLTFPLIGLFFSAFFACVGYPFYRWRCRQIQGQKLSGFFIN